MDLPFSHDERIPAPSAYHWRCAFPNVHGSIMLLQAVARVRGRGTARCLLIALLLVGNAAFASRCLPWSLADSLSALHTEHWKNSKVAKADAVQWVNQRNLRIVLEHVTAELLQAQPDDPLEFMIDVLQRGQEESEQMSRERPATTDSSRPATAVGQGKEDEVLEAMQAERDKWRNLYDEEAAKVLHSSTHTTLSVEALRMR